MTRLDDLAVEELRDGRAAGETVAALAERHGISERHVRRLTAGIEVTPKLVVDPDETVGAAVSRFLAGIERNARDEVRASVALSLAARLDLADARAAPALARGLVDVLDEMGGVREPPDALDELRRRRDARLLAAAAGFR